ALPALPRLVRPLRGLALHAVRPVRVARWPSHLARHSAHCWRPAALVRLRCWPGPHADRRPALPGKPNRPALAPLVPASSPRRRRLAPHAHHRWSHNRPARRLQTRPATMRYALHSAFCTPLSFSTAPTPVAKLTPAALKSSRYS